jgi:HSP20 family molecular chaperone IbpA
MFFANRQADRLADSPRQGFARGPIDLAESNESRGIWQPSTRPAALHYNRDVASRAIQPLELFALGDFARMCDEMFDDLLVSRWRQGERVVAIDRGDSYQVKIATANADPQAMELEVSDYFLHLRVPAVTGASKHTCRFAHPIDTERVTASWREGVLQIVLPKRRPRKIAVA